MRFRSLAIVTALAASTALAVSASGTTTKGPTQPAPGSEWTGVSTNGGKVTLEVKKLYDAGLNKSYLAPYLKWTKVGAVCREWNGSEFVETPRRITAEIAPTTIDGAIRKGKFEWDFYYDGKRIALFKGTFKRKEMQGKAQVFDYHFVDRDARSCKWGPLRLDLARSDVGQG